jgi:hypothetical protein
LGAPDVPDAVAAETVALPSGSYASLKLLASAVGGSRANQSFVITYTDGTTSTFVQSLSDWGGYPGYPGESIASTMTYRVTPNGATQNGPWYVYGYSFTLNGNKTVKSITLPGTRSVVVLAIALIPTNTEPSVISVSPYNGTGNPQAFTANYFDPNGASGLNAVYLMFNTTLSRSGGCYVQYYPSSGLLFMKNDAGTGYVTPSTGAELGSAVTLANSQCSVSAANTTYAFTGDNATFTVPVTFTANPLTNIYLYASEKNGTNSGWVQPGTWGGTATPKDVSIAPNMGGNSSQVFTATYGDTGAATGLNAVYLLFNNTVSKAHGCYVQYYPPTGLLFLEDDAGTGYVTPATGVALGSATTLSNSQCSVSAASTTYAVSGNNAILTVPITFISNPATNIYMFASEKAGTNSGWVQEGTWGGLAVPSVTSVSPNSGTGATQAFTATISDTNGAQDLNAVFLLANGSISKANSCYVQYYPTLNLLYLLDNTGNVLSAGIAPGSAVTVSNSQCTLSGAGSSYTVSGTAAALTVNLAFIETKAVNLYVFASDGNGTNTGWVTAGTWTP